MFDSEKYMEELIAALKQAFGSRLAYVGLQGSYLRNEATEESDIDPMVVIDGLSAEDLKTYRSLIERMEHPEKSCGFICGKDQLANWNALEIYHLLHSTKDLHGELGLLIPVYTREDMRSYIKLSLNNLSHAMCHRSIHAEVGKHITHLPGDFKSAFFILQDLHALRTGVFLRTSSELVQALDGADRAVLKRYIAIKSGAEPLEEDFKLLFDWCSETMAVL
ncbi:MAG: nucleotidyltransferase domain-containing protein [Clostridia bacterium]|nr:nucleotidyltransferase domain-containing protein [Clostridia bacterium]